MDGRRRESDPFWRRIMELTPDLPIMRFRRKVNVPKALWIQAFGEESWREEGAKRDVKRGTNLARSLSTPEGLQLYRRKRRDQKRNQRARRRAAGLTAAGAVPRAPLPPKGKIQGHPWDCPCFECLFPPEEYRPLVYRVVGLRTASRG